MNGINKVILVATLGQDPETRYTSAGEAVTNMSVATSEKWKDKSGNQQEKTEWHKIVIFKRLAEVAAEYLKKGSKVYLEGKLQTRKWQDNQGQDRWSTEIIVNSMQMLDSRISNSNDNSQPENQSAPIQQPTTDQGVQQAQIAAATEPNVTPSGQYGQAQQALQKEQFDDDLPF